jgi:hypothetical protein
MLSVALISQLPTTNLASMSVGNCEAPHWRREAGADGKYG